MLNNKVKLCGEVISGFCVNHIFKDEIFLLFELKVKKDNNNFYTFKIITNKKNIDENEIKKNNVIYVEGEFHSYNDFNDNKSHLNLFCFAKKISKQKFFEDENFIFINGYICKTPVIRNITNNQRICDILVAVNRRFNKSDYIPCVAQENHIENIINKKIGDSISFNGILQSRHYIKKISETVLQNKVAYEVIIKDLIF